ncbi:MAG: ABC transporter permease [Candidatus Bathyarchaeota archaeon]|uniref:ABC transporter permease n=1 Tax=Candidatus Bathycorpusculum sp. TaxID=2994959 RepID=UPI002823D6EA|nr:ABC transporter permease [Candidatus Termiticorpusculum sp.]MCL2257449.1 ABC transporter permease [Candidatus Termiticorpusculum sp.]MCL2292432.1 ABC transporter permease [Candidatus Termiticorpusculum sp.]
MTEVNIRKSPAKFSIPKISSNVWKVWRRNADVFTKTIGVNFLPSLLEPILYLFAFGLGLGNFIPEINGMPFINFIAPALVAISLMNGAFFECTYGSFVRMYFQKTFDALVATPISIEEVVAGELLWGATRGTINCSIVLAVVGISGFFTAQPLITSPLFLLLPIIAFFAGLMLSSIAMCFTAVAPNIDFFNYPIFLIITPMLFLSGTFFPLASLPHAAQGIALTTLPLTHIVNLTRGALTGTTEVLFGLSTQILIPLSILWIALMTIVFFIVSINLMKKRLIR